METTGEIFEKLKLAVEYNGSAPPTKGEANSIQKRLPNLSNAMSKNHRRSGIDGYKSLDNAEKTLNQQLQTERISTETLKRFENFLFGAHSGAFCQIMDIFVSGYGELGIDNDVLCVRLVFERKIFHQIMLVVLEHHVKRKTYESNITHLYNIFSSKDNEQHRYKISHTILSLVFE